MGPLGLGECIERERLRRKKKAFGVFEPKNEKAFTREIGRLADVSIGTLSVYARDKRHLLFLALKRASTASWRNW